MWRGGVVYHLHLQIEQMLMEAVNLRGVLSKAHSSSADVAQGARACRVENRLDTLSGCDTVSNQERPHEWGRGRQECLRHGLPHRHP